MDIKGLWFRAMMLLADAWLWLRNTNWKTLGLAVLVYMIFYFTFYGTIFAVFGWEVPSFLRFVIGFPVVVFLINFFDRKYPGTRSV